MKAGVYLRISLDKTGDELGVQRQREDCLAVASKRDWQVTDEYTDNDTSAAGKVKRPEFDRLLADIDAGQLDVVIAWNLDRLTRNRPDTVKLIETCRAHSIVISLARGSDLDMSTPMGRMMADQLAGWARYEIEQKGDRHRRANEQAAKAGKPHGSRRPFGYESDLVTIRPSEAALLREMARRVISGQSCKTVAFWLNREGHKTTLGKPWYAITVKNMLSKPRYAGIRTYYGAEYPATWPAILDEETWRQVQLAFRLRSATHGTPLRARKYLLTGLAVCGKCGMTLTGSLVTDHPGLPKRRIYMCRGQRDTGLVRGCGGVRRNADALDDFIKETIIFRLDTPDLARLLASGKPSDAVLHELLVDREAQMQRLVGLADDYATGLLSKPQLARANVSGQAELRRLDAEIKKLEQQRMLTNIPAGLTVRKAWEEANDEWRRALVGLLISGIVVNRGITKPYYYVGVKRYRFDPRLIDIIWN